MNQNWASKSEIQDSLDRSLKAFSIWKTSSAWQRSEVLNSVAKSLEDQKEDFAQLICTEVRKPITFARAEVDRAITVLKWAASEAQRFSGEILRLDATSTGRAGFGIHQRFPRGVILGITPFNFPLNLVAHKVAPAIASGNTILIKPSPFAAQTAIRFAALFNAHHVGLVQVVMANDTDTATLTLESKIAMISFTGSARVGWQIRKQSPLKPTTLELGGNAWVFVAGDVDEKNWPAVAKKICVGAFGYAGQSCISVQNVAVAASIARRFFEVLKDAVMKTPFGDPQDPSVISGPLIHLAASQRVEAELKKADAHIQLITSKNHVGSTSDWVIPPTLALNSLSNPSFESCSLVTDEIFGPVMTARAVQDSAEFTSAVNQGSSGLQAGIFTQKLDIIQELYKNLEIGGLVVNDVPTARYDHQPYGGVKESGQGREGLKYAMEEMTEAKFLALSAQMP